jgi:hypothetical protein
LNIIEYIDLDSLPNFTKQEVAEHQLDRAICLLLDENDPICAITLAGAAEEILGKIIELDGGTHSLKEFINECIEIGKRSGEKWQPKEFAEKANFFRNELKHYVKGEGITVSPECAYEIIDRASENLFKITGDYSRHVQRYMKQVHGIS